MCPETVKSGTSQGLFVAHGKGAIMEATRFELKYCEMCGALGLRRSQSCESYCEPCGRMLTDRSLPRGWGRHARVRKAQPPMSMAPALARRPVQVGVTR